LRFRKYKYKIFHPTIPQLPQTLNQKQSDHEEGPLI